MITSHDIAIRTGLDEPGGLQRADDGVQRARRAHTQRLDADDLRMEKRALAICRNCPVIFPCRQWAMGEPDPAFDHVAGGLTPAQRWAMRR